MRYFYALTLLLILLTPSWVWADGLVTAGAGANVYTPSGDKTSDALIKTGKGVLHTVVCASDAIATAGTLAIRDGVAAGGGTIMQQLEWTAIYNPAVTLTFDVVFTTGLYLDFTTTADVHCSASYR